MIVEVSLESEIQERVVHAHIHTVDGRPEHDEQEYHAEIGILYLFVDLFRDIR
jgi:hypothetical protein